MTNLFKILFLIIANYILFINTQNNNKNIKIICENGGTVKGNICLCKDDYMGNYCETKRNCYGYERYLNGSCIKCQEDYRGIDCIYPVCKNGEELPDGKCKCKLPYSGESCSTLKTTDVYLHYNRMIYRFGPIGAFIIIPMVLTRYGCSFLAKKRQIKRVERSFEEQNNTDISTQAVKQMLNQ